MPIRNLFLLAAAVVFSFPAFAAPPVDDATLVSEAKGATPERFPNADIVFLDQTNRTTVDAAGSSVSEDRWRAKALTEKGRRDLGSHSIGYNLAYDETKIAGLRIIKPDGRVVTLDPAKQSSVQQDPSSAGANIYDPNDRRLVAAIPGVELGDVVEIATTSRRRSPMKECFFDIIMLESDQPSLRMNRTIVTPKSHPLAQIKLKDGDDKGVSFTKKEVGDNIEYSWTVGETPQYIAEPDMPSPHLCVRRILVSTVPDWGTISRWYWIVSEPHYKITPEIKAKADALTKGIAGRDERIRAIYRFVSQEIRYMGVIAETEAPGFEPHDVSLTFDKRYGVCRDKAALLAVMLRAAGFESYPVLINAGDRVDPDCYGLMFNHAITGIRNDDGSYELLDSTNESTKDIFPEYLANCSYLVATPEGETLRIARVPSAEANMISARTNLVVGEDGSLTGASVIDFGGINDTVYRGHLTRLKKDETLRFIESAIDRAIPGARVADAKFEPENMQDTSAPLKLTVSFNAPDFLSFRDGRALLRTPFLSGLFSFAGRQLSAATVLEKRRFPLRLDLMAGARERVTVALPEKVRETLALPGDKRIDSADLHYSRSFKREGSTLTGDFEMRMKRLDVPAADYAALRSDMREIGRASKRVALLSADAEVKADSRVLSRALDFEIIDGSTTTLHVAESREILTYAGKKNNAEVKLGWNAGDPEPVVEKAFVTDAAGARREVGAKETNVLDADWVASAPRYTPARTKVISLPSVETGSRIDIAYSLTKKHEAFVSWQSVFASFDSVDACAVTITAPANFALHLENLAGATVVKSGDKVVIRAASRILPTPKETNAAPASLTSPSLSVSSLAGAPAYAEIVKNAIGAKAAPDDAVRAKAAALLAGAPGDAEARITLLRDFVAKSIRTAGPDWRSLPLAELTSAGRTLADGYGHEADKHILFSALLDAAGFKATPALYSTDEFRRVTKRPGEPFDGDEFGVFGTRIRLEGGRTLDFTRLDQYAELDASADLALPLDARAVSPVNGAKEENSEDYRIVVSAAGDATVTFASRVAGPPASGFARRASEATPEEISRWHQGLITGLSRDATPVGGLRLKKGGVGELSYDAKIADFAVIDKDYAYFDIPGGADGVFPGVSAKKRVNPYAVGGRSDKTVTWSITLPKGWEPAVEPAKVDWDGPGGVGRVTLDVTRTVGADDATTLVYTRRVALRPGIVSPDAYPALSEINRRMSSPEIWRVLLKKK